MTVSELLQLYLYHRDAEARQLARSDDDDPTPYNWPDLHDEIQGIWAVKASELKGLLKAAGTEKFKDHVVEITDHIKSNGCVKYEFEGKSFWIPTALTRFTPEPAILAELHEAAERSRHYDDPDSRMCLSGSTVLMGEIGMVGDLDLFEYVTESAVTRALKKEGARYEKREVICVKVAVGPTKDGKWPTKGLEKRDKTSLNQNKMRQYAAKLLDRFDFCKIDMIGNFNDQVGEITNIIFRHEDNFDFRGPFPSFAFQEVVVGDLPPPKESFSLKNLGEYLFWLRDEIDEGLNKIVAARDNASFDTDERAQDKAIKISKRALVLAALTKVTKRPDDPGKDILDDLRSALEARESRLYSLESAESCLKPLRRTNGNTDEMVSKALQWLTDRQNELTKDPPPNLDIDNLIETLQSLITAYDRLCYPDLPLERAS